VDCAYIAGVLNTCVTLLQKRPKELAKPE
jgi:hypothetical protein